MVAIPKRVQSLFVASWFCLFGLVIVIMASAPLTLQAVEASASHKQVRSIVPRWNNAPAHLNTFSVGPDRLLYLCCTATNTSSGSEAGVILVYSGDGELVRDIPLEFVPQAINFGADGKCFVAGAGKIARLSSQGSVEIVKGRWQARCISCACPIDCRRGSCPTPTRTSAARSAFPSC
jgi:hypothetical protein